jgi:hypothetical protein
MLLDFILQQKFGNFLRQNCRSQLYFLLNFTTHQIHFESCIHSQDSMLDCVRPPQRGFISWFREGRTKETLAPLVRVYLTGLSVSSGQVITTHLTTTTTTTCYNYCTLHREKKNLSNLNNPLVRGRALSMSPALMPYRVRQAP